MKIIFFTHHFYPHIGGVENHVYELSSQLVRLGHNIAVICEDKTGELPGTERYKNIDIYRINLANISEKKKKFYIWFWLFSHINLLKSSEIIHIHDVGYWIFPIFLFIHKNRYITFHGYEGSKPPKSKAIIQRKIVIKLTKGSINVGSFMEKWYKYHAQSITYGAVRSYKKIKRNNNNLLATYIGRMHNDTGIMTYLKALTELKRLGILLELDVYGDGELRKTAEFYTKKNKLSIKFWGFSENIQKQIPKYKYAFVSRYLSILEAMLAKVPVLAVYNNQIKKDYLDCHPMRENFFVTNDPKKLAVQIIKLQKPDAETKAKIERAHQWAKKQTWEALTKVYTDLWGI